MKSNYPLLLDLKKNRNVSFVLNNSNYEYIFNSVLLELLLKHHYEDIKIAIYSKNKYYSNQVKKIISTVKAEPFGDEIDLDEMIIEIILGYSDVGDVVTILQSRAEKTYGRYTIFVLTTR